MQTLKLSVTLEGKLRHKYDPAKLKQIESALKGWRDEDAKRGIYTLHVEVDNAAAMKEYGVAPVKGEATAPKIKRTIDALWKRLSPDYLVLFGGDDIVPMFRVANPFDDSPGDDGRRAANGDHSQWWKEKVPTDNPYASSLPFRFSDPNTYLIPDRVIGRIPDMASNSDPTWLVSYLKAATKWKSKPVSRYTKTYAICSHRARRAAERCMKYISRPDSKLLSSPPTKDHWIRAQDRLSARLHMIKCHGSPGDPKVYGLKWNDYPYAIRSATLSKRVKPATVVATMCCYGAQIYSPSDSVDKAAGWPVASTYLRHGALGFVGPTVRAYAGNSEMLYADWIVAGYLNSILGGASIGRAFLETKQDYSRWTNLQGQAHGVLENLTLIEYVLLGDPSVTPVTYRLSELGPKIDLAAEELRQRRVARAQMARQIRTLLPKRSPATPAEKDRAKTLFSGAQANIGKDAFRAFKQFAIKPTVIRVQKLHTPLRAPGVAQHAEIKSRQSVEYWWSGRRGRDDGQNQICLLKAETDAKGKLWRAAVIYSS